MPTRLSAFISFIKRRYVFVIVALFIIGGIFWFAFGQRNNSVGTIIVKRADFVQQVSVSGKVVAAENVDLSFEQTGIVRQVAVHVGDHVQAGKLLGNQDVSQLSAQLSETQAGIDLQKAKLNQLLAGATPENIKVAEDSIALAQQNLQDSYDNAIISLDSAYSALYQAHALALSIQNSYFYISDQQSLKVQEARLSIATDMSDAKNYLDIAKTMPTQTNISTAIFHMRSDLGNTYQNVSTIRDQCDTVTYYTSVTATDKSSLDTKKASINTALSTVTSSQQAINADKIALQQAQSNLNVVTSPPRQSDIDVYQAQIKQAEASLQNIVSQIRKRQIYSPIEGTVAAVNAKQGAVLNANDPAFTLISSNNFEVESYVPQIYISSVKLQDEADVTLDAYGQDRIFKAKVISVDPSETLKDGVSTYKTTLVFVDYDNNIKDGMTANVLITTDQKQNVIAIPQRLVTLKDGKKWVKVQNGKNVIEKEVQTGEVSSSGQIEITSGLQEGDILPLK